MLHCLLAEALEYHHLLDEKHVETLLVAQDHSLSPRLHAVGSIQVMDRAVDLSHLPPAVESVQAAESVQAVESVPSHLPLAVERKFALSTMP